MVSRYDVVVRGEASETDSDEEVYITSLPATHTAVAKVLGEASETDSEGDEDAGRVGVVSQDRALPPLIVLRDRPGFASVVEDGRCSTHRTHSEEGHRMFSTPTRQPSGDTLLQQKLQESNSRLHGDVGQTVRQVYSSASREVRSATAQLNASQSAIIAASHSVRLILDDLKAVAQTMDAITSCHLLPGISIPP